MPLKNKSNQCKDCKLREGCAYADSEIICTVYPYNPLHEVPEEPPIKEVAKNLKDYEGLTVKEYKEELKDNVNHPKHYKTGKFESIDVMVETQGKEAVQNFCICNAFKYIYRHRFKNGVEDIKKAIWYLNKYVELEE